MRLFKGNPTEPLIGISVANIRYYMGPTSSEELTHSEAVEWCQSQGDGCVIPPHEIAIAAIAQGHVAVKGWLWTREWRKVWYSFDGQGDPWESFKAYGKSKVFAVRQVQHTQS